MGSLTDFNAWILSKFGKNLVRLFSIVLLPWSIFLAAKQKRLNAYYYEVSRGWDILANKMFAPVLNKKLGPGFGQDETISQRMAFNKHFGLDTEEARKWEKRINYFDKNHLEKTTFYLN